MANAYYYYINFTNPIYFWASNFRKRLHIYSFEINLANFMNN